jgi:hypothetical protein
MPIAIVFVLVVLGLIAMSRWSMADDLGDLDQAGGTGASGTEEGGQAGGQEGAAGTEQATGEQAADPWQSELPEWAREKFGVTKFGELQDRFQSLEQASTQQETITGAYQDLIRMYQRGQQAGGGAEGQGQGQGQNQASPQNNWFGYGSREAYVAAFGLNPEEVRAREQLFTMQHSPEVRSALQQMVQEQVKPLHQAAYQQTLQADYQSVAARYPEAQDKAVDAMVVRYAKANPWVERLKQVFPEVNLHEVAFKLGHYDQVRSELAALRGQQKERAQAAGTARSNVGGQQVRKAPKTHLDAAEAAAEKLRAMGIDVPQEMVEVAKRGITSGGVHSV